MHNGSRSRAMAGLSAGRRPPGVRAVWGQVSALAGPVLAVAVGLAGILSSPRAAQNEEVLWDALPSGSTLVLMRHAIAPGTGDPADFRIGDCSTQRTLSAAGREQAVRIGERFRDRGIPSAQVFSSEWCRCLETARLLGLGPVSGLPLLNSFYEEEWRREPQTLALQAWLRDQPRDRPMVLVTHQVNITALTGVYPASGELVFVHRADDGALAALGSLRID